MNRWGAAVLHGISAGTFAEIRGGKFGHGFISAGITSALGESILGIENDFLEAAASSLLGGTVSELTGGKFANGAISALIVWKFNDNAPGHQKGALKRGSPITDEQLALAKDGKFVEFWRFRHAAGDPVAKTALAGWDLEFKAGWFARASAKYTWSRLSGYIESNSLNVSMEQIGAELALEHAYAVRGDTINTHNLLSPQQVAEYHHTVFAGHNIPAGMFGGTHNPINPSG